MRQVVVHRRDRLVDDFFKLDAAELSFERFDGTLSAPTRRLCLERGDSVAALLYDRGRDRVILVEQFRWPTHDKGPGWTVETVAGMVADGETPAAALRRELRDEAGYEVEALLPVADFYLSPGGSSERVFLYYAEVRDANRVAPGGGLHEEGEDIRLVEFTPAELRRELAARRFHDAKTLIAVQWLLAGGAGDQRTGDAR